MGRAVLVRRAPWLPRVVCLRVCVRAKEIALEKVQAYMVEVWPGQSAAEKKTKVQALNYAYGTTSWKEVETFGPDHIRKGLEKLREFAQKQVSREPGAEG